MDAEQISFLGAQIEGLRLLLTAHIETTERLLSGSAAATANNAEMKRRACLMVGQIETATALEALLDNLRDRFDMPAND
ncbi:hypothetical protein KRZ98_06400 [Sphingobium sp. AS12]|uniref:hypothetical protein n=1 Tax=Sphingobium sp. AS12 TaxID=2849495 RepID=UPI001C31A11D|nr:hypothetical protein [Sphingobium sp. AS12]MBV2147921.1 hypothetical protein [Sphingobium sp. AS12]